MNSKKSTVVMLRWVLIIAFSYLLILDPAAKLVPTYVGVLISVALASNLLVGRFPPRWTETGSFDVVVVLFDTLWVTLGLTWAPTSSSDLFLLYFLVIFVAAVGESLRMIAGSAVVVALAYAAMLSMGAGGVIELNSMVLLRLPFLFVVALLYGYFVVELRTRRREALQAKLREQAKTELLATVSHDVRGPLGDAENLLTLALEAYTEEDVPDRSLLLRAVVDVRRVSSLVANLLQAATIEAGKVHFQMTPLQLNEVVGDAHDLAAGAAHLKSISLLCDLDPKLPEIEADHLQLGRIVSNLVDNAIKYTHEGGRVALRTAAEGDSVRVLVQDNGPGLTREQCASLFTPYRRGEQAKYTQGAGLGLYIVKRLAEAQGGNVSVDSQVGLGSTFTVSFPRVRTAHREIVPHLKKLPGGVGAVGINPEPA